MVCQDIRQEIGGLLEPGHSRGDSKVGVITGGEIVVTHYNTIIQTSKTQEQRLIYKTKVPKALTNTNKMTFDADKRE